MSFWLLVPGLGMGGGDEIVLANSHLHALPYPIYGARFSLTIPYLDADGDPTDPVTPDTEISKDGSATFIDTDTEVTIQANGWSYLSLSSLETQCNFGQLAAKVASGPKNTLASIYPKRLPVVLSTTLAAVTASGGTLNSFPRYDIAGCFIRTMIAGGTSLDKLNEARRITSYNTATGVFGVEPQWDNTSSVVVVGRTVDILAPEGVTPGMIRALNPTIAGNTLDVTLTGEAGIDWANIGSQTATANLTNTDIAPLYHFDGKLTRDQINARDEYKVNWMKSGIPITSGVTSCTIQVIKGDDTDLIASTAMTQVGSAAKFKYDESTNRATLGEAYFVRATATIDGLSRTFEKTVSQDAV